MRELIINSAAEAEDDSMRIVQRRLRKFYVGTLKRRGSDELGLVVFTADDQSGTINNNYVRLYELAEDMIRRRFITVRV
jgi:hypothetical protein